MRLAQQRARQTQPLPLSARQPHAAIARQRIEPVWQASHQLGRMHRLQARPDLGIAGLPCADPQIGAQRVVKQRRVLRHVGDARPPVRPADVIERNAVDRQPGRDPAGSVRP